MPCQCRIDVPGAHQLGLPFASIAKDLGVSPSAGSSAILQGPKVLEQQDIETMPSESGILGTLHIFAVFSVYCS